MDAILEPKPWNQVCTGSTVKPRSPVPISSALPHRARGATLGRSELLPWRNWRGELGKLTEEVVPRPGRKRNEPRGMAAATTHRPSPGQAGDAESLPEPSRWRRLPYPMAPGRSEDDRRGGSPSSRGRTSAPTLPALRIQRTMVPARVRLRPPARRGFRKVAETTVRRSAEKPSGFWRRRRRAGQSIPEISIDTQRFPALKALGPSKVGGASEEGGVEVGGKSRARSTRGS